MCAYTEFDHISQAPDSVFNYHCEHVFSTTIFLISAKFVQKLYLGKFFKNAFCLEPNFELQAIHIQISIIKHMMNFLNALKRNQNYPEYDSSATFLLTLI